jgi:hypothetical protein
MLLFINLKVLLKKLGIFFYLITLVFVLTTVCILYIFAYSNSYIDYRNYTTESYRSYTVLQNNNKEFEEKLEKFMNANARDIRRIYAIISNKDGKTIANYYGKSVSKYPVIYGSPATSENEIAVPYINKNNINYSIGDSYQIQNKVYKITGISFDTYEILYDRSLNESNLVQGWVIVSEKILTDSKQNDFVAKIKDVFQIDDIELPQTEQVQNDTNIVYIIIFFLALLSVINLTFIYSCLLKRRKQQQAVFYILGCKKRKLYDIYIKEMVLVTSILYIICCILARFVLFDALTQLHPTFSLTLSFSEYLILFLIYVILLSIILTYQTALYFRKTPYEMKRG